MKKSFSKNNKLLTRAIVWFIAFLLLLGSVIFLAVRPVSYEMRYHGEREDEYGRFEATTVLSRTNFELVKNSNCDLPFVNFYYYKDGYYFTLRAKNLEEYALEAENINNNWEAALERDFYATKINAYKMVTSRPDGAETIYYCYGAIVLTSVASALTLGAAVLSCVYFVGYLKTKKEEDPAE